MLLITTSVVGGIYSVIKSKAPVTTAEYGDRYTLIGPLNHQSVRSQSEVRDIEKDADHFRRPLRSRSWNRQIRR